MSDVLFISIVLVFFAASYGLLVICERLMEK
jgi:hypothetical protein